MNSKPQEISSITSEEIEKMIKEESSDIKNYAKNLGGSYAERNYPPAQGVGLLTIIAGIKARFEKLGVTICKKLQSAVHFPEVNTDKAKVEAQVKKGNENINELRYKNQDAETEQKKLNVSAIYNNVREMRLKTLLFFAAEAFFTSLSFQFFGETLLISILIAIPFTAAVSEYAHLVAQQYRKYVTPIKKRVFLALATLFAALVFLGLSYFRSLALGKEGFSIGTLFFVLVNIFIFLVAAFLHYRYSPTKEELLKYRAHKKLKDEIDKRNAEIKKIEHHMDELKEELNKKAILALQLDHYAKNTLEEIRMHYLEAITELINANIRLRTDNAFPESFTEKVPELEINYDFNSYKSTSTEEHL